MKPNEFDSNKNLDEQKELAEQILQSLDKGFRPRQSDMVRLAELVIAFAEWRESIQ